jgi:hypothetical protein
MTTAHIESRIIHDIVIDPEHADRTESPTFRKAKERLKQDGHYKCWVCGIDKNLQVHHFAAEYMHMRIADLSKVKDFVETFDVYGYGRLLNHQPLTSIEDVRCMMVLCQTHHTGVDHDNGGSGTGIHDTTFPTFLIQKLAKDGMNPVPQPGESANDTLKEIEAGGTT